MTNLSPGTLNAWRIYCINLRLKILGTERDSRGYAARQRAIDDIARICSPDWAPDVDALTPRLIDEAIKDWRIKYWRTGHPPPPRKVTAAQLKSS